MLGSCYVLMSGGSFALCQNVFFTLSINLSKEGHSRSVPCLCCTLQLISPAFASDFIFLASYPGRSFQFPTHDRSLFQIPTRLNLPLNSWSHLPFLQGHLCGWTFEFTVEVGLKTMKRGLPACPPCDGLSVLLPLQIPFVLWQGCPREHSINPMGSGACQRCDVPSKTWWWIGSEARGGLVLPEASGTSPP